jgi:hypothetical protein
MTEETKLKQLQALRSQYSADNRTYWALTMAIDVLIGLSLDHVIADLRTMQEFATKN